MRWINDGAPLERMIERSSRLTPDELRALAQRFDPRRSRELRRPITEDLAFGMAWNLLPPQAYELYDVVTDAAARAGVPEPTAKLAWEAVADAMAARLFPELPPDAAAALRQPWSDVVHDD